MSKDIRSFFTVVSKKSGSGSPSSAKDVPKSKKIAKIIDSDDDIVEETPPKTKHKDKATHKKRAVILSSDSDDEQKDKSKKKEKSPPKKTKTDSKESKLKPVDISQLFSATVKQKKVDYDPPKEKEKTKTTGESGKKVKRSNPELGVHNDEAFEKTLIELDEDDDTILLENMDLLEKTMEEAEKMMNKEINKKQEHKEKVNTDHKGTPGAEDKKRPRKKSLESNVTPSSKKQKLEHTDSGIDNDQERWEKKRYSAALYQNFLHRGGPKHHGAKEIPEGKPDCLHNLTFLRTGVLDSLDSEEFDNLIKSHGGRLVHAVSKKVNFVVVGDEPGPSKLEKARNYKIPQINEDELLDMILVKSGMKPKYCKKVQSEDQGIGSGENSPEPKKKFKEEEVKIEKESPKKNNPKENGDGKPNLKKLKAEKDADKKYEQEERHHKEKIDPHKKEDKHHKNDKDFLEVKKEKISPNNKEKKPEEKLAKPKIMEEKLTLDTVEIKKEKKIPNKKDEKNEDESVKPKIKEEKLSSKEAISKVKAEENQDSLQCWTEKYRPTDLKSVIGQQEPNSNMNKLRNWLKNWDHNQKPETKRKLPRPTPWNQFDGAYFKAALLSGSPGVGKTTTASLVARDLGYDIVEFNASDTRSKKLLQEEISHMRNQKSVSGFAQGHSNLNKKRVLLMDEVDGMAGNEDRGGIGELINLIKLTNFPIICMCNDRNHQKMRTLVTHCFGLKFNKPPLNQVRGAMMSICFKEGLRIKPDALAELINGTGCDIRQTLNNLSMWSAVDKNLTDATVKSEAAKAHKDVVFGPWDVVRKVFSYSDNKSMSVIEKAKLFFYDYSLGPLFVQENYLRTEPMLTGKLPKQKEILMRMCLTAESLAMGDQVERTIRSTNNWSLLDSQAYFSTVCPSYYMSGKVNRIEFPGWFGKNSKQTKTKRLISELHSHMRASASGDRTSIKLDYCIPLRNAIVMPLKKEGAQGVKQALEVMKSYSLLREDLTNLVELCQGFKNRDIFNDVDSKVKTAFTRAYNKEVLLPFAPPAASKKKRAAEDDQFGDDVDNDDVDDDVQQDDNVENDGMIKVKPTKTAKGSGKADSNSKTSKAGTSKKTTSKGKGKK